MSKPKWETRLEKYMSEEPISEKIEKLSKELETMKNSKVQGDFKTKTDYENAKKEFEKKNANKIAEKESEIKRYKIYEKNKDKLKNTLEIKQGLIKKTQELLKQKEPYDKLNEIEKKENDLLSAKADLVKELKAIEMKLANSTLKPEEYKKLEEEKQEKLAGILKNEAEFIENDNQYIELSKQQQMGAKIGKFDIPKINAEILRNEKLIAKCDLILANLLIDKSMDEIGVKLENFNFKPNKDFAKKIQEMKELNKGGKEAKEEGTETLEGEKLEGTETLEGEELPKKIGFWDKFLQKHPKIAEITNRIKNIFKREKEDVAEFEEIKEIKEDVEEMKEETGKDFDAIYKKFDKRKEDEILKGVAEMGTSGFRDSIKVEQKENYNRIKERNSQEAIKEAKMKNPNLTPEEEKRLGYKTLTQEENANVKKNFQILNGVERNAKDDKGEDNELSL